MLNSYFFDIVKSAVSGLILIVAVFYLLKPYLDRFDKQQLIGLKQNSGKSTLSLRLQAYERLVLFIDRTNPVNLLIRLNDPNYSAGELYYLVLTEIRNEYQHNITQQIYVSASSWEIVKRVKEDTISLMNSAIKASPPQTSGLEFSKLVLEQISRMENSPYEIAAMLIRNEAQHLF